MLVLLVGSELIRNSVDRWFNAPVEEVLTSADLIASDYYRDRQARVTAEAQRLAGVLAGAAFDGADVGAVRDRILPDVKQGRVKMVAVYRVTPGTQPPEVLPYVDVAAPDMPRGYASAVADRMAAHAASGQSEPPTPEQLPTTGELIHAAAVVRRAGSSPADCDRHRERLLTGRARVAGAAHSGRGRGLQTAPGAAAPAVRRLPVVLSDDDAHDSRGRDMDGSLFAKRITEPVLRLATAAREIEAGHLDYRVDRGTVSDDEFGSLVEAFNSMANEVGKSRRRLERSTVELERSTSRSRAPPLHRNDSRAHRHRRRVDRRVGEVAAQQRSEAAAGPRTRPQWDSPRPIYSRARISSRSVRLLRTAGTGKTEPPRWRFR